MTACNHAGCAGEIDETGFCTVCYRRPAALPGPASVPGPTSVPELVRATTSPVPEERRSTTSGSFVTIAEVRLPLLPPADPRSRLRDPAETMSTQRVCGKNGCDGILGGQRPGRPPRQQGHCPKCGTYYSFLAKLSAGELVAGQYEVLGPLAQSGFGWVYLAQDKHLDDNYVVLKGLVNANDTRAAEMAVRERQYLTRLNHPNIVRIYNAVTHPDKQSGEHHGYIVMEYVDGSSLQEIARSARRSDDPSRELPVDHILAVGHEILAAMDYLHGMGLLYCDMKPDNVMRGRDRIIVIDLGGMCRVGGSGAGTPGFEVGKAELEKRGSTVQSDLHTVGRTLERLLEATSGRGARVPTDPDTDVALHSFRTLVERATNTDPDRRFTSAAEMSEQLIGVLHEFLSQRDQVEYAKPSPLFAPTAALIDGGLGRVPPLTRWTRETDTVGLLPSSRSIALGLPLPRVDPDDRAARFLTDGSSPDPRDLIGRLSQASEGSTELLLRGVRAYLELGDLQRAARCLDDAAGTAQPWRVTWYRGLMDLFSDDLRAAMDAFGAVRDTWPGESAPKLALALCEERVGDPLAAARLLRAVWLRDSSQTAAAFGLARLCLAERDRDGAIGVLDQVPPMSPHHDAAGIAAFRALIERLGDTGPSVADLERAAERLPRLRLDGGDRDGDARQRLTAMIRQAALGVRPIPAGLAPDAAAEEPLTEETLRRLLEQSYRHLAGQARTAHDHEALVDRANRVRPRTLLTSWRR